MPPPASNASDESFVWICGKRMYVDPSDARARALSRANGPLHLSACQFWQALVDSHAWDLVVDAGANYGEMLLTSGGPPGAALLAIEPNPRVLPSLRRTLAESLPMVDLFEVALSDRPGPVALHDDRTWWGNSTLCEEWVADREHDWSTTVVEAMRLSDLVAEDGARPTTSLVLKLDVEGMEIRILRDSLPLFKGLRRTITMLEVVRCTDAELDWLLRNFDVSYFQLFPPQVVPLGRGRDAGDLKAVLASPNTHDRDISLEPIR